MKEKIITLLFLSFAMVSFAQTEYYYYKGEKIYLTKNYQFVTLVTANAFDETSFSSSDLEPFNMRTEVNMRESEYKKYTKLEFINIPTNQSTYSQKLIDLKNQPNVEGTYPYYSNGEGVFGTSNYFMVKLNQASDYTDLQTIAIQEGATIIKQMPYTPLWYMLSINTTTENAVTISADFYESGLFASAEPVMTGYIVEETVVNNTTGPSIVLETCYDLPEPNSDLQWNLFDNEAYPLADINICGAWEITKGDMDVKVCVIDTGVDDGLLDLPVNINDVYDPDLIMDQDFYTTQTQSENHGTNVAGVISARHNGAVMGGIAPGIVDPVQDVGMLYAISDFGDTFNSVSVGLSIYWAIDDKGAKVINMSFASGFNVSDYLKDALDYAIAADVVLVAGAGNGGSQGVLMPAKYQGVLAVGSSNGIGEHYNSNTGFEIDVVAPGDLIVTTDFGGNINYNFNSTSAATPHVTGIAALMLSANIDLKGEAVRNIIRRTAQKSGSIAYDDIYHDSNISSWNEKMGYGIPDATACVKSALEFETEPDVLDVYMRNSLNHFGVEPDNVTKHANNVLWNSPDIWVPAAPDGELFYSNADSIDYTQGNTLVMVRVINKSNKVVDVNGLNVELYWSKLSNTNSWPYIWDGSTICDGIPVGGMVGTQTNSSKIIKPGEQYLFYFNWEIPNPSLFENIFPYYDPSDFSFLARIVSDEDPITINETPYTDNDGNAFGNVWQNAKNSNNIAWKNVSVVSTAPVPNNMQGGINIINKSDVVKEYSLEFKLEDSITGTAIFEEAEVTIQMNNDLYQEWESNGAIKTNMEIANQQFIITEDDAIIDNIRLDPCQLGSLKLSFNFLVDELTDKKEFTYHFIQRDKESGDIISGKTFYIKKGNVDPFDANAGDDKEIDKNESITLSAVAIDEPATYNWYDPEGNLIYTGMDITLSPELTRLYTLEIIKDSDGLKDYDEVVVEVNPFVFGVMSPNPAINNVTINYIAEDASSAYFMFTEQTTGNAYNHILDTLEEQKTIDVTSYPTGIYLVSLICDGNLIETQQLLIN